MVADKKGVNINKRVTQAVILAGGLGTRLKPFTNTAPKPMYPINNIPFIDYLIRQMKNFGMEEVLLLLGYLPEKIMDYLGDGSRYGLIINYDITPVDYDTGMRIKHAYSYIAIIIVRLTIQNCSQNFVIIKQRFKLLLIAIVTIILKAIYILQTMDWLQFMTKNALNQIYKEWI